MSWTKEGMQNSLNMMQGKVLNIGDKMRFSVDLIGKIKEGEVVVPLIVVDISPPDSDGIKTVTLGRG